MRCYSSSPYASQRWKSIRTIASGAVRVLTFVFFVFLACMFLNTAVGQQSAPAPQIWDLPTIGPPETMVLLQGVGFDPLTPIELYFDSSVVGTTTTDVHGWFGQGVITATGASWTHLQVPADALPGPHTITAQQLVGQKSAQKLFVVRTDWPQFRYGPDHLGVKPYEFLLSTKTVPNLALKWRSQTPGWVSSSPAVVGGVVFVGGDGYIYALDGGSGNVNWKYPTGWPPSVFSSPAVANGVVYVGADDNNVYALYSSDGSLKWKYTTSDAVRSSPTVVNGTVYVGSEDKNVYALDADTGAKKWSYTTAGYVYSSPAVVNNVVYVGSEDPNSGLGHLYALEADTGYKKWQYDTGGYVDSSPAVASGVVYFGCWDGFTYALNANDGSLKWKQPGGLDSPAVTNDLVYVGGAGNGWELWALNSSDGSLNWKYQTGSNIWNSSPAVANGVVYFGSFDKTLYALNADTGAFLWSYITGDAIDSSPVVVDGVVYVGSDDHWVYAFSLP